MGDRAGQPIESALVRTLRRVEVDNGKVLLDERAWFHLVYRLAARSVQVLIERGQPGSRRRMAWAGTLAAVDMAEAGLLRRRSGFFLGPRLLLDASDTAIWASGTERCDEAALTGVPLAIEAGMRLGLGGLIAPAVSAAFCAAARRHSGRSVSTASFRWQVMGVAAGVGLAAYEASYRRATAARHSVELDARRRLAEVAGQNAVAMGADSVVDLLARTAPLLRDKAGGGTTGMMAGWKHALAESTAAQATYLGWALKAWELRHNAAHADLSADVVFQLPEGAGTVLLTASQADSLFQTLDRLPLRGLVQVQVADEEEALRPDSARRLVIGGTVIFKVRLPLVEFLVNPGSDLDFVPTDELL